MTTNSEKSEYNLILKGPYISYRDVCDMYDVKSIDDAIKWSLENEYEPINTIQRVINCAWDVYGRNITSITTNVINYYHAIASTNWIKVYVKTIEDNTNIIIESTILGNNNLESVLKNLLTKEFIMESFKTYYLTYVNTKQKLSPTHNALKKYIYEKLLESMNIKI